MRRPGCHGRRVPHDGRIVLSRYSIAEFRYPNPTKEPEAFLDTLEKVVRQYKREDEAAPYVLMPLHKETYLIARHRCDEVIEKLKRRRGAYALLLHRPRGTAM